MFLSTVCLQTLISTVELITLVTLGGIFGALALASYLVEFTITLTVPMYLFVLQKTGRIMVVSKNSISTLKNNLE